MRTIRSRWQTYPEHAEKCPNCRCLFEATEAEVEVSREGVRRLRCPGCNFPVPVDRPPDPAPRRPAA